MTTKAVGNRRLLKLANLLETVPKESFKMTSWLRDLKSGAFGDQLSPERVEELTIKTALGENTTVAPKLGCGFAACAIGWACSDRSFRRAGLRLKATRGYAQPVYDHPNKKQPYHQTYYDYQAIAEFFSLDGGGLWRNGYEVAKRMFGPSSYRNGVSPAVVAGRIRAYVEGGYKAIRGRS